MALTNGTVWELRGGATASNVNGAGFNPANAHFPTDGVIAGGTGNTPTLTSATYTFVSPGDVGAWVYFPSQTNITSGWYKIASVAGGVATLSAAIGQASQINANTGQYITNTVAGCATTAAPTGVTYGVDYSQQNTAQLTKTDLACTTPSTTVTSSGAGFTPVMVGNIMHITAITGTGTLTGWFEIVSYTNATTVVLDRTPAPSNNASAGTYFVGGAGILTALEDAFLEMVPASSQIFITGTHTLSGAIAIASTNSTTILPSWIEGYTTTRGDRPTPNNVANMPVIAAAGNAVTLGQAQFARNISWTTTASGGISSAATAPGGFVSCKVLNSSTTASRNGFSAGAAGNFFIGCECISQNGFGISAGFAIKVVGCYFHDSVSGISSSVSGLFIINNVFEANTTSGIVTTSVTGLMAIIGNTIYGREAKMGIGISLSGANSPNNIIINNILYGLTTGISIGTSTTGSNLSNDNTFFNNTTDVTNFLKDATDIAVTPSFVGASQVTGTTGSGSGSTLTDTNANFTGNITDNVDFLHQVSGTGATVGCFLITSHTNTTLVVNNTVGTNATADRVYYVTHGHNFAVGNASLKGTGFPDAFVTSTGYMTQGAVQPNPTGAAAVTTAYTF